MISDDFDDEAPEAESLANDPLASALEHARVGEVEALETPSGVAVSLEVKSERDVARVVPLVSRLHSRIAVSRRMRPGLVALDLRNLCDITGVDERSCLLRAGAGARVRDVEARAIQHGLTLGPLLPSTANKTVAAWLCGPTRGDRAVPGGRLETAALALEAVLADGSEYRSKEVPRSATGPDLDHLLLGGEGRFGILTRATLRLMPRALVEASGGRAAATLAEAISTLRQMCVKGAHPAEARWDSTHRSLEVRFTGMFAVAAARKFGTASMQGRAARPVVEVAGTWAAWKSAESLEISAVEWVCLHTGGAFGSIELAEPATLERTVPAMQGCGLVIVSPRRLRPPPASGWTSPALYASLAARLDPGGVFDRWAV